MGICLDIWVMTCVCWRHSVIVIAVLYRSQIVEVGVTIVVLNRTLKITVNCIIPRTVAFLDIYPVIVIANLSDGRHPQFITAFALKLLQGRIQSEILNCIMAVGITHMTSIVVEDG